MFGVLAELMSGGVVGVFRIRCQWVWLARWQAPLPASLTTATSRTSNLLQLWSTLYA
jgi:hypothetical protein